MPAIPANGPDVLCDDDVGGICWRFDLNLALMSRPKRPNLSAGWAENPPQASSGHTLPVTNGNRRVILLTSQTDEQGLTPISAERNSATIWNETAQFLPRKSDDLRRQG